MPSKAAAPAKAGALAAAAGDATDMTYRGGPVETTPAIYLIYWGSAWSNSTQTDNYGFTNVQAQTYISAFFGSMPGSSWASTAAQYCQGVSVGTTSCAGASGPNFVGNPSNIVKGVYIDTTDPLPSGAVDDGAVQTFVRNVSARHFNSDLSTMYLVFTPHGVAWTQTACAWHGESYLGGASPPAVYAFIPYVSDLGASCYANRVNNGANPANGNGSFDSFSIVGGHEYAEALTDPQVTDHSAWYDSGGFEIGDKCTDTSGNRVPPPYLNIYTGGAFYAVQSLWSNSSFACVVGLPAPMPRTASNPTVTYFGGAYHVYARDASTGNVLHAYCYACNGYDWSVENLGGVIVGAPSVVTYGSQVKVLADGGDGQTVYQDTWNGGWSGWQAVACCGANPTVNLYNGAFHIYARDTGTAHLIHAWCVTCTGSDWVFDDLGGIIVGAPSVTNYNGQVKAIVDGGDGRTVWQDTYPVGGGWSWQSVACCGDNVVGSAGYNGAFHVYAHDTATGHLIHAFCYACEGSDWVFGDLGGIITGTLSVSTYNGQVKVIVDGSDGQTVWQDTYPVAGGWSWQGIAGPADSPAGLPYVNNFQLVARSTSTSRIVHAWCVLCDGSDWNFEDLGSAR